jgi:putative transposase
VESQERVCKQSAIQRRSGSIRDQTSPRAIFDLWAYTRGEMLDFSPTDNAFIEAFNSRFRTECVNAHWFLTLADAQEDG